MDTSDPEITFDDDGVCNHCRHVDEKIKPIWHPDEQGKAQLDRIMQTIREEGEGKEYDCILGISGGIDSSYLAKIAKDYNLRPLVVHIDAGWNSELAVSNVENVVRKLGFDLFTCVIDWEEVRDVQLAFLKAGVANQDVPQDHVFFAELYKFAVRHNIKYVLNGSNFATESILPSAWGYNALDRRHLTAIHKRFGKRKLKSYSTVTLWDYYIYFPFIKGMKIVKPLNYLPYDKDEAISYLEKNLGWQYYGGKHHESRWTKFFQSHYLPTRFGFDKRRAHYSSMINAGAITRDEALEKMSLPAYNPNELPQDMDYICKKLGISRAELEDLIAAPIKTYKDYPNNEFFFDLKNKLRKYLTRSHSQS